MKRQSFLPMVVAFLLAVAAVGCTTVREIDGDDGYYGRTSGVNNRVYVDDPYRGTVVLERDPYTGRYYEANGYGAYGRYRTYDPYYRNGYDPYYRNSYPRSGRRVVATPRRTETPPPTRETTRQREQTRSEARNKILGKN